MDQGEERGRRWTSRPRFQSRNRPVLTSDKLARSESTTPQFSEVAHASRMLAGPLILANSEFRWCPERVVRDLLPSRAYAEGLRLISRGSYGERNRRRVGSRGHVEQREAFDAKRGRETSRSLSRLEEEKSRTLAHSLSFIGSVI